MERKTFDISLPTRWEELTDRQLHLVFDLFARDLSAAEVKTLCLMKWNALQVLASLTQHRYLIKRGKVFYKPDEKRKESLISSLARKLRPKVKEQVVLSAGQIQQATRSSTSCSTNYTPPLSSKKNPLTYAGYLRNFHYLCSPDRTDIRHLS